MSELKLEAMNEVDDAIATIAKLDVEIMKIEAKANEKIKAIEEKAKADLLDLQTARQQLEDASLSWAKEHREAFGGKKTLSFNFGAIKFDSPRPSVVLTKEMPEIVDALKVLGVTDIIKTVEYVEKTDLKKLPEEVQSVREHIGFDIVTPAETPHLTVDVAKIQLLPVKKQTKTVKQEVTA